MQDLILPKVSVLFLSHSGCQLTFLDEVDLPPADKNGDVESFVKQEEEISASNQDDDIKRKHTESDDPIKPKKKKPTVPEDPKPITRSRKLRM